ncbi:MAG: glycosyltransferase [Lachnospiraceae bacterium]|nr:glycosyltransferase [Lachnospiraceae bacterium]
MVQIAEHLAAQGVEVTLVTQTDDRDAPDSFRVSDTIRRRFSDLTKEEITKSRLRNFLRRYRKLQKIWEEERPDLILSFIGKNNVMAIQTAKKTGIPVVAAVRGNPALEYEDALTRKAALSLFPKAAGIVVQTKEGRTFFPESIRKKCVIFPNPIEESFCKEKETRDRKKDIVCVGRIDENKNQRMLLHAFTELQDEFSDYRLCFYGTGPMMEELQKEAEASGLKERVLFAGHRDDIAEAIRDASAFVLPSDTEGMPNALLEAMALELPVIATDCPCGGPRDLIEDRKNGLLIPVRDKDALREALRFVLTHPEEARKMGKEAGRVRDRFAPEKALKAWSDYLRETADGYGKNTNTD